MDLINNLINITVAPLAVIAIPLLLPPYLLLLWILSALRWMFSEDVAGKVVLVTGASSGIGEHLAYEYAKRGACLALVARRENRLREVAAKAEMMGSPEVIVVPGDVSKVEDCMEFVNTTVKHFGRLDHLVANAGVTSMTMFEDVPDITKLNIPMDINFWGSVYCSHFAIPHLKKTNGKIIVIASCASWLTVPRMSFYCASKAALVAMYETLRTELAPEIGITIVTPGLIDSEMTGGKFLNQQGKLDVDQEMRDVQVSIIPLESTEECAKSIVRAACRGDKYLIEPYWYRSLFYWKVFWPDVIEWSNRFLLMPSRGRSQTDTVSKKIFDLVTTVKESLMPNSEMPAEFPELIDALEDESFMHHAD